MKQLIVLALFLFVFLQPTLSATISCPTLSGDSEITGCFKHSATNPVTTIQLASCGSSEVCDLRSGKYAWIDSTMQQYSSGTTAQSQVYAKYTDASCVSLDYFFGRQLNNGRKCTENLQCVSRLCNEGVCQGKVMGDPCSQHSECNAGLSCYRSVVWPHATTCQIWGSSGTSCNDDYDCKPKHFCW